MKKIKTVFKEPRTDEEIANIIGELGDVFNEIQSIETSSHKAMKRLEKKKNLLLRPLNRSKLVKLTLIFNYLEAHRDQLIDDASKTYFFDTGKVWWRFNPEKVVFRNEAAMVARLERLGLHDLVKTKKGVKKKPLLEYLKKNLKKIRGAKIVNEEELYVRPNQAPKDLKLKRSEVPQLEFEFAEQVA